MFALMTNRAGATDNMPLIKNDPTKSTPTQSNSTQSNRIQPIWRTGLIVCLLVLTACQTATVRRPPDPGVLSARAEALYDQGNYPAAADIWESLAISDAGNASAWQLRAADAWLQNQQPNIAASRLASINQAMLNPPQLAHWQLLRTELVLLQGDRAAAGQLFERLTQQLDELPSWLNSRVARLNVQLGDPRLLAANAALSQLRSNAPAVQRRPAFYELARLPGSLLSELESGASQDELSYLSAIRQARESAVQRHFSLIKTPDQNKLNSFDPPPSLAVARLVEQYPDELRWPKTVAVLLPTSGQLKPAAEAIHQGIVSSWLGLPEASRPRLVFIDSGESNRDARGAYFSAIDSGADWIVGPLRKESVAALIDVPNRNLPILALNQPQRSLNTLPTPRTAEDLAAHYVFALPPEDDARAAARLALQQGHRSIIILRPDSAAGLRLAEAFETEFNQQGGRVLQSSVYANDSVEYTDALSGALRLDASLQRHAQLQRRLGLEELGFRQQGRSDVDALFVAGNAAQARLIIPQLKFLDLDYLPVYATRRIYEGSPNPRRDRDLNGVYFTQQAWLADQPPLPSVSTVREWYPDNRNALLAELFGLGRDSLLLLPYLNMLQGDTGLTLQAASGQLQVSDDGYITRDLQAMQFRNGLPVFLNPAGR